MKKLNQKVFKTIFFLLSIFIIIGIIIYNIDSYKTEYENVKRNLTFMEDRPPEPKTFDGPLPDGYSNLPLED